MTVKLLALMVDGAIASVNATVIAEFVGTPAVGPGVVVVGTVSSTPGRVRLAVPPVVNTQT